MEPLPWVWLTMKVAAAFEENQEETALNEIVLCAEQTIVLVGKTCCFPESSRMDGE